MKNTNSPEAIQLRKAIEQFEAINRTLPGYSDHQKQVASEGGLDLLKATGLIREVIIPALDVGDQPQVGERIEELMPILDRILNQG